jgi:hypothetical protein
MAIGNHHSFGQVHLKSNAGHDAILGKKSTWGTGSPAIRPHDDKKNAASGKREITKGSHFKTEEPFFVAYHPTRRCPN